MSLIHNPVAWAAQAIGTKVRLWLSISVAIVFYALTAAMILAGEARASIGPLVFLCGLQLQFLYALHRLYVLRVSGTTRNPGVVTGAA